MSKKLPSKIDHFAIQVDDIAKAIDWYTSHFDCQVTYQDESWGFLAFDNVNLALVLPKQHPRHIAFKLEEAIDGMKINQHRDGTASAYTKDPFGNVIEFMTK